MGIAAETVYLFRLPILRDAAYQLQVPSDRARLHRLALEIMEEMFDGPPPEPQPDNWGDLKHEPHTIDPVAADLAEHVRGIRAWEDDRDGSLLARELLYTRRAAEYAEMQFDDNAAVGLWRRLAELLGADDPATAAEAIRRTGAVLAKSGRAPEAEPLFARARSTAAEAGDRRIEGMALGNFASVYQMTGRMEEARRTHEQALAILREVGDRRAEGMALGNLANVYGETGRMEEAERNYKQALTIHRETGNRRTEGTTLGNLANVYQETGRVGEAQARFEQAVAISRETNNRRFEGLQLCNYALCLLAQKRADAGDAWEAGAAILKEVGDATGLERKTTDMREACAKAGVSAFG